MGISFIIYGSMSEEDLIMIISDKWERFLNHVLIKQVDQKVVNVPLNLELLKKKRNVDHFHIA